MIRVILADSHQMICSGINTILSSTDELTLIATVTRGNELQNLCYQHEPDVLLLALNLDIPYLDMLDYLKQYCSTIKVLVLLANCEEACLRQLTQHSVAGAILKSDASETLIEAIYAVAQGETWFSHSLLPKFLQAQTEQQGNDLTERELEVLQLMVAEKTDKEISQVLEMAERTVRCHLGSIYAKLGVKTRVGAAVQAVRLGLIQE